MKVLVCGSRHFEDYERLKTDLNRVHDLSPFTEIIHGDAVGADRLSGRYGEENGIPVRRFPALWDLYGKAAGPIRNLQMLREGNPDSVIAFLAVDSRGTANMIAQAEKAGVPVKVINIS